MIHPTGGAVTLMVDDLDRAQAFYTETLGLALEYRAGPHFAMVSAPGLRLGLHPRGDGPSAGGASGITLGLEVPDLRAAVRALEEGGVAFPGGVVEDGPILRADFRDPDGTPLHLVQTEG